MIQNFQNTLYNNIFRILFSCVVIFSVSNELIGQDAEKYNILELKEDFDLAKDAFYNLHPRPFQWFPKDSFDIMWDHAEEELQSEMTSAEFSSLLYPMFQKLGCGHSRVFENENKVKQQAKAYKKGAVRKKLPLNIKTIDGKTYVNKYFGKDSLIAKGDQLLAIDQVPIESIKKTLKLYITSDGLNTTHYERGIDRNFVAYFHRLNGYKDQYEVAIVDSLGEKRTIELKPYLVSKAISKKKRKAQKKNNGTEQKNKKPAKYTTLLKKDKYRFLKSKKDTSVVILKIPSFAGKAGKKTYKKAFKIIKEDPSIENLVIDLRGNGGGDAQESWFLTSALNQKPFQTDLTRAKKIDKRFTKNLNTSSPLMLINRMMVNTIGETVRTDEKHKTTGVFEVRKKNRYDGKLFVLIDGYSFSASSVVSSYLKSSKRAVFIGEETGGGMYGTNAMASPILTLPNTTVRIRIGLWALDQIVEGGIPGRGIFPDHETTTTYNDFMEERDPEMEKVYELIDLKD